MVPNVRRIPTVLEIDEEKEHKSFHILQELVK